MARSREVVLETVSSIETVRSFATEEEESRCYGRALDETYRLKNRRDWHSLLYALFRRVRLFGPMTRGPNPLNQERAEDASGSTSRFQTGLWWISESSSLGSQRESTAENSVSLAIGLGVDFYFLPPTPKVCTFSIISSCYSVLLSRICPTICMQQWGGKGEGGVVRHPRRPTLVQTFPTLFPELLRCELLRCAQCRVHGV